MHEYRNDLGRDQQSGTCGFGVLDADLRYLFADSALSAISGSPVEALVGRSIPEIQAGWARILEPLCRAALETGESVPDFVLGAANAMADPVEPVWRGRLGALRGSTGRVSAVMLSVESLERAGCLHFPGVVTDSDSHLFAALEMLSHDYRNRLAPILSAAQMIRKYGADKPEVLLWAGKSIEHQVRQMTDDLNGLIDLAQLIMGKVEWHMHDMDLNPILHRVGDIAVGMAYKLDKRLNIDLDLQSSMVFGDPGRLEHALGRLYRQVIESAPPAAVVESSVKREGDYVLIRIGEGHSGALERTPEWSLKSAFDMQPLIFAGPGGLGPGFAFANQVIRQHGGSVSKVNLGHDRGIAVVVRIPSLIRSADRVEGQGRDVS